MRINTGMAKPLHRALRGWSSFQCNESDFRYLYCFAFSVRFFTSRWRVSMAPSFRVCRSPRSQSGQRSETPFLRIGCRIDYRIVPLCGPITAKAPDRVHAGYAGGYDTSGIVAESVKLAESVC